MTVSASSLLLKRGRKRVLSDIAFEFRPGLNIVLGRNGAGKTTLLEALALLKEPVLERVAFGQDSSRAMDRKSLLARIGFIAQSADAFPSFTATESVEYAAWLKGVPSRELTVRAAEALDRVGMTEHARTKYRKLSGGMKQRVNIAASLVHDPALWILDEPTVGLDPEQRTYFRGVIAEQVATSTVILSTHLIDDVEDMMANVLVIGGGGVIFSGSAAQLVAWDDGSSPGTTALERGYARLSKTKLDAA